MRLCYARCSEPSALDIAEAYRDRQEIELVRSSRGDINWGRQSANTMLNPDISNVTNKRRMRELFKEHDVPMPELVSAEDAFWEAQNRVLVGRPDKHTKGRGFWLCNTPYDVRRALRGTRRKRAATHFMEYIDAPHEYRVHVFKGKSIRISEKLFGSTGATARGNYTTIKPTGEIKHVRKAAKRAVAAVGLDFGAVDILADDENCWVLEVNAAPALGGTMPQLYADVFRRWQEGEFDE